MELIFFLGGKIITVGWSREQELVFVIEDGTVIIYTIYGELIKTTSMGQEAKGQLISKCLFSVIIWTKIATKILQGYLPLKIF